MSAGAVGCWKHGWGQRIHFQIASLTCLASLCCLLAGASVLLFVGLSLGSLECLQVMATDFPQNKQLGRLKWKLQCLSWPSLGRHVVARLATHGQTSFSVGGDFSRPQKMRKWGLFGLSWKSGRIDENFKVRQSLCLSALLKIFVSYEACKKQLLPNRIVLVFEETAIWMDCTSSCHTHHASVFSWWSCWRLWRVIL